MPGSGKTVLVRHWIDTVDLPVAWLSLDRLDGDPASFWAHLIEAVQSALPAIDDEPAILLGERGVEDPVFLAALVAQIESSDAEAVLVLDGLPSHLDRLVLDGLTMLVERIGDTLPIVVTARSNPALPLARWRTLGWLDEVREHDLLLSDDEAAAIASTIGQDVEPGDAALLNQRVGGWPLGLHMMLLGDRQHDRRLADGRDEGPTVGASDPVLAGYLVADILDALTERQRNAALSLSVLDWFDPDLCEALAGDQGVVRDLLERSLFLTVVDRRTGAMRFHPLFRELMEMELSVRDPARRIDLHRRAATIWRDRGNLMVAYHHLSAIGETARAHELLVAPAFALIDGGNLVALRQFATQLPALGDIDDAGLALEFGRVALHSDGTVAARRWCDRASTLANQQRPDGPSSGDLLRGVRELHCTIALLDADLDTVVAELDEHPGPSLTPTASVFEQRFPIIAARTLVAARRVNDAAAWIRAAAQIAGPDIITCVTVPTVRGWYDWLVGDLRSANARLDAALQWMDEHDIGPHHHAFDTLITGAWCQMSEGRITDAARLARRARSDAKTLGAAWFHLQAGYLSARLALVTGDPIESLRIVDDLRGRINFDACQPYAERILGVEIEGLAARGRLGEARRLISTLSPSPRRQTLLARFSRDQLDDVDVILAERATWPASERLQADIIVAARADGPDRERALAAIVAECADSGWVSPFLDVRSEIEGLLSPELLESLPRLGHALAFVTPTNPAAPAGELRLTSRELALVELLPTHLTYAAMGEQLYLSVNTVKAYLKSLYRKLDARTRDEAVAAARGAGLL